MQTKQFLYHNRTLAFLLFGLFLMNVADYVFTIRALAWGIPEWNPLIAAVAHTPLFPLVKLGLVSSCLLFIWFMRNRINRLRTVIMISLWCVFIVYAWTTGWHFYWQLIRQLSSCT